jgi:hypothetical protein
MYRIRSNLHHYFLQQFIGEINAGSSSAPVLFQIRPTMDSPLGLIVDDDPNSSALIAYVFGSWDAEQFTAPQSKMSWLLQHSFSPI